MPWIYRDDQNNITGYSKWQNDDSQEFLADDNEDYVEYKKGNIPNELRIVRNQKALCAIDAKSKFEREQISISNGISISYPMVESDYIIVLQYLHDLFDLPEQEGFPWNGPDDPLCPWPIKPDCVYDTSIG